MLGIPCCALFIAVLAVLMRIASVDRRDGANAAAAMLAARVN
jgi:hypothetical protein